MDGGDRIQWTGRFISDAEFHPTSEELVLLGSKLNKQAVVAYLMDSNVA